jgi:tripartite-type tricarboxylate transporter receptor subunit TctC
VITNHIVAFAMVLVVSGNFGLAHAQSPAYPSRPDGYTLLVQYSGYHVANPSMFKELPWSPTRDFTSVGMALVAPHGFVAHPSLPVKNLADLGRLARSQGGALSYASSGVGSIQHIGMELCLQIVNAKMVRVPGPATIDLVSGQIAVFNTTPPLIQHVRSGRLRALA